MVEGNGGRLAPRLPHQLYAQVEYATSGSQIQIFCNRSSVDPNTSGLRAV